MVDGMEWEWRCSVRGQVFGYSSFFFFFLYFFRLLFGRKGKNAYLCAVRDK